jgi:hypothetical protein
VSELQLALIALALLALLALYMGEKWQEHRRLRRLRERLHGGVGDVLLQTHGQLHGPVHAGASLTAQRHPPLTPDPQAEAMRSAALGRSAGGAGAAGGRVDPGFAGDDEVLSGNGSIASGFVPPGRDTATESFEYVVERGESGGGERDVGRVTSEPVSTPAMLLHPDWAEDPLLDCSLEIRCARAVDGVSVIDAAANLGHANWKLPVHFVVWDGRHQQWVLPDRFGYYTDALASIQLADRRVCIDEAEIARFVQVVQQLAQTLGADLDLPDPARLVVQAQELDRLCARFDIRIGLTVESGGTPWTGPQLRNAAQECGFTATGNQRWVRRSEEPAPGEQGLDLYSLQVASPSMTRLALELDIALAPVASRAFASMVDSARDLAAALGGRVVDDNGKPIEAKSVDAIERQLAQVFEEMRAAGVEPGTTRARRLYA